MSKQISAQATKLWQVLSASSTLETYKQTITVTWQILKETALLLWLVVCLVLVAYDWIGTTAVLTGRRLKTWYAQLQNANTDQLASQTGQTLLQVGKTSFASTVALAREQLGLPEKPPLPEPEPAPIAEPVAIAPAPTPAPVSAPAPTPAPVSVPASPASASPTVAATDEDAE
ncbi:MAG TPA: hypothetical protein V6C88_09310 [Chroococcidiopsis sp.]